MHLDYVIHKQIKSLKHFFQYLNKRVLKKYKYKKKLLPTKSKSM